MTYGYLTNASFGAILAVASGRKHTSGANAAVPDATMSIEHDILRGVGIEFVVPAVWLIWMIMRPQPSIIVATNAMPGLFARRIRF